MKKPVQLFIFTSRSIGKLGNAIAWITSDWYDVVTGKFNQVPSHVGIGFVMDDGSEEYFEALLGKGWEGPKNGEDHKEWVKKNPGCWVKYFHFTHVDPKFLPVFYARCIEMRERWKYHVHQFLQLYMFRRFGKKIPHSPNQVVCCEAVCRILVPEIQIMPDPEYSTPKVIETWAKNEASFMKEYK